MRFGMLVGVGFPHPIAGEALVKIADWVAIGGELGFCPKLHIAGADVKLQSVAADVRVFPFRGSFFVGVRGGHQTASASITVTANGTAYTDTMDTSNWYVNPRVGFLWTSGPGFTVGSDAGVQIPIASKATETAPKLPAGAQANFTRPAQVIGSSVIPQIDLIRVGVLF